MCLPCLVRTADYFGRKSLVELKPDGKDIKASQRGGRPAGRQVAAGRRRRCSIHRCGWLHGIKQLDEGAARATGWLAACSWGSLSHDACLSLQVTNENKREYVNLVARHRMTTAIRPQIESFLKGFWEIVPRKLVRCAAALKKPQKINCRACSAAGAACRLRWHPSKPAWHAPRARASACRRTRRVACSASNP